jgi:uncharacterized membrane protein YhiD involved in acid resistance
MGYIPGPTMARLSTAVLLVGACAGVVWAQTPPVSPSPFPAESAANTSGAVSFESIKLAFISLPLATVLGAALALRPRRAGTPARSSAVVQTQIILAIIGALIMLVVGVSLARAFGVVGAAGLIRYRAKVQDPKDAGVMLATLAVGLASGVGLYQLAIFAAVFIVGVLWIIESFEPQAYKLFTLTVKSKEATRLEPAIKQLLGRNRTRFEVRSTSPEELAFEIKLPMNEKTDSLTKSIGALDPESALEWEEKKNKDAA